MPAYTNALTADYSSGMSIPFFLLLCLPFQTLAQELEHLGCYVDSTARIFPHKMGDFGDNTPATCSQRCFDQDNAYIYSNVQYGLECWCSSSEPPASSATSDGDCTKPCTGDASLSCGEAWRANVYKYTEEQEVRCASPPTPLANAAHGGADADYPEGHNLT